MRHDIADFEIVRWTLRFFPKNASTLIKTTTVSERPSRFLSRRHVLRTKDPREPSPELRNLESEDDLLDSTH
jgi:hypothetical protein